MRGFWCMFWRQHKCIPSWENCWKQIFWITLEVKDWAEDWTIKRCLSILAFFFVWKGRFYPFRCGWSNGYQQRTLNSSEKSKEIAQYWKEKLFKSFMSTVHTNIFLRIILEIIRDNHVFHLERTGVFQAFLVSSSSCRYKLLCRLILSVFRILISFSMLHYN